MPQELWTSSRFPQFPEVLRNMPVMEVRPAKPVDRASVAYERRRFAVADHCVVFDASGHMGFNVAELGVPK